jgi:hypothetical protein
MLEALAPANRTLGRGLGHPDYPTWGQWEGPRSAAISWFVWKGEQPAPLVQISPAYRLRYSHEHGYRFDKQELLWDVPRLSTPERTERWTQVVACAHNQLVLARPLVDGSFRP